MLQDGVGPAEIESVVGKGEMLGVGHLVAERQGWVGEALLSCADHNCAGVDAYHATGDPHEAGEGPQPAGLVVTPRAEQGAEPDLDVTRECVGDDCGTPFLGYMHHLYAREMIEHFSREMLQAAGAG